MVVVSIIKTEFISFNAAVTASYLSFPSNMPPTCRQLTLFHWKPRVACRFDPLINICTSRFTLFACCFCMYGIMTFTMTRLKRLKVGIIWLAPVDFSRPFLEVNRGFGIFGIQKCCRHCKYEQNIHNNMRNLAHGVVNRCNLNDKLQM